MIIINNENDFFRYVGKENKPNHNIIITNNINLTKHLKDKIYLDKLNINGNNYTIKYYSKKDSSALFDLQGGTISNVIVDCQRASLNESEGWLVSKNCWGNIKNCHTNGIISGKYTGGICGENFGNNNKSVINNCSTLGNMYGSSTGGIVGSSAHNIIFNNCISYGKICGNGCGGISGYDGKYLEFKGCCSSGNIMGSMSGGLCGFNSLNITINNCFTTGNIGTDNSFANGGLISSVNPNSDSITINNCYTLGNITTKNNTNLCSGGLIGIVKKIKGKIKITNCYTFGNISNSGSLIGSCENKNDIVLSNIVSKNNNTIGNGEINHNAHDNFEYVKDKWNSNIWNFNYSYPKLSIFDEYFSNYNLFNNIPQTKTLIAGLNGDLKLKTFNSCITNINTEGKKYTLLCNNDIGLKIWFSIWNMPKYLYYDRLERLKNNDSRYNKVKYVMENTQFLKYLCIEYDGEKIVFDLTDFKFKKYDIYGLVKNNLEDCNIKQSKNIKISNVLKKSSGLFLVDGKYFKSKHSLNLNIMINTKFGQINISAGKDSSNIVKMNSIELSLNSIACFNINKFDGLCIDF